MKIQKVITISKEKTEVITFIEDKYKDRYSFQNKFTFTASRQGNVNLKVLNEKGEFVYDEKKLKDGVELYFTSNELLNYDSIMYHSIISKVIADELERDITETKYDIDLLIVTDIKHKPENKLILSNVITKWNQIDYFNRKDLKVKISFQDKTNMKFVNFIMNEKSKPTEKFKCFQNKRIMVIDISKEFIKFEEFVKLKNKEEKQKIILNRFIILDENNELILFDIEGLVDLITKELKENKTIESVYILYNKESLLTYRDYYFIKHKVYLNLLTDNITENDINITTLQEFRIYDNTKIKFYNDKLELDTKEALETIGAIKTIQGQQIRRRIKK